MEKQSSGETRRWVQSGLAAPKWLAAKALSLVRGSGPRVYEDRMDELNVPENQRGHIKLLAEGISHPPAANLASANLLYLIDKQIRSENGAADPDQRAERFVRVVSESTSLSPEKALYALYLQDPGASPPNDFNK